MKKKLVLQKQTIRALTESLDLVGGGSPPSKFVCPETERNSCRVCDLTIGKCSNTQLAC